MKRTGKVVPCSGRKHSELMPVRECSLALVPTTAVKSAIAEIYFLQSISFLSLDVS